MAGRRDGDSYSQRLATKPGTAQKPDNTKVAVIKACLYEPQVNRTYAEMAAHYDTAILPARPPRPRDKAKSLPPRRRGSKPRY